MGALWKYGASSSVSAPLIPTPLRRIRRASIKSSAVFSNLQRPLLKAHPVVARTVWMIMHHDPVRSERSRVSAAIPVMLQSVLTTTR